MTITPLTIDQIKNIYNSLIQEDFPADEIKPFSVICSLFEKGQYSAYGLFDNDKLLGYAFFCKDNNSDYVLLDYYAIVKDCRKSGLGSYFLSELKQTLSDCAGILIEAEAIIETEPHDKQEICRRRQEFYFRNGCVRLNATVMLHSARLDALILPCDTQWTKQQAFDALCSIYSQMLPDDKGISIFPD